MSLRAMLRAKAFGLVEIVLRVPPLFVIDEIIKAGVALPDFGEYDIVVDESLNTTGFNYTGSVQNEPLLFRYIFVAMARLLLSFAGCAIAMVLFVLTTKHLMVVYMYLMSVAVVFLSYWANLNTVRAVMSAPLSELEGGASILDHLLQLKFTLDPSGYMYIVVQNYVVQCVLAFIFVNIHLGPRYPILQRLLPLSFLTPSILCLLPVLSPSHLQHTPVFAALLPLALAKFVLWASIVTVIQTIYAGYLHCHNFVSNWGMSALVENEWVRLSVPEVLRTFWLLRVLENAGIFFITGLWTVEDTLLSPQLRLFKSLMVSGCDTLTAVLGITSIVSYICHHIGKFFQWVLLTEDENDKSIGTVSAILFYILALQTGLTGLDPEKRFVRLCRNFCLLFTALLHFIHNIVNPLLMSLSASHNPSLKRHVRALSVCVFLVIFPILLLYYLWSQHNASTWLLAVSAFSVEVIVKVGVSLCIYTLFLLDARRSTFWEKLDDYVYYIRAFGNTVEFCFGIFLFFNGAWILIFESGGAIRAVMMCIHAYFNIWCDARTGWSVFMKRRTAVKKIDSLPEAEADQLRLLDDVCAICYQEMRTAKITRCRHFFHGVCLRKWLYVQDRCPLCHEVLHSAYEVKEENGSSANNDIINNAGRRANRLVQPPAVAAVAGNQNEYDDR